MADEKENPQPDRADASSARETKQPKPKKPLRKRLLSAALFCLYVLILLEVASRIYWYVKRDVPFFCTHDDFYVRFYEEVRESGVMEAELGPEDGHFDVLMLGGSAMDRFHRSMCAKTNAFQNALEARVGRPVRAWNLANVALTTRDSAIKYRRLEGRHFDLVIVYHGINDVRLNNAPPDVFRDDYTHAGWYVKIRRMDAYGGFLSVLTVPYTVEYTIIHILESKSVNYYVPRHRPNPEWMAHGDVVRTAGPFEANLREILAVAERRQEPVILATFAWHIPEDYSLAKLKAGELPYARARAPSPVENWGLVPNVAQGLRVHNEVTRRLGREQWGSQRLMLAPVAEEVGQDAPQRFCDVCHLSDAGKEIMLRVLVDTMRQHAGRLALRPGEGGLEQRVDPRPAGGPNDQDRADQ